MKISSTFGILLKLDIFVYVPYVGYVSANVADVGAPMAIP
jgi:hypothetical protein